MENDIGRLVISAKKSVDWISLTLPDGQKIRFIVKDHKSGNPNLSKIVIDCPKSIKISRSDNDSRGNR